jgi:hypothetical protein
VSNTSTFTVTLDGKAVSIPLERARALCPAEVAAMEAAGEKVSAAAQSGDQQAAARAAQELERSMTTLLHALAEEAKRRGLVQP